MLTCWRIKGAQHTSQYKQQCLFKVTTVQVCIEDPSACVGSKVHYIQKCHMAVSQRNKRFVEEFKQQL
jgi:hypothetical protein